MSTLIRHEEDRFRTYDISEIYLGDGGGVIVPNVGDMVVDKLVGIYFVTAIDPNPEDPRPSLELKQRFSNSSSFDAGNSSLITAFSLYDPSAATVVFADPSVTPITATIDERWRSFVDASHGVLFLGTDVSAETGIVISALYNESGNFVSNDIPYETVSIDAPSVKRPKTFNMTQEVKNGQVVTLVDYNAVGDVVGKRPFLIEHSSFIRPSNDSSIQLTGFTLNSVLMDPNDANRILNPINTPLDTSTFNITLNYSDGSKVENVPINGSKVVMHGVENFNSSQAGRPSRVAVSYYPSETEPFIGQNTSSNKHITNVYLLANVVSNTSFSLKLFVVPEYVSITSGYKLNWYLTNLERDLLVNVTDMVTATVRNQGAATFNGKTYGETQTLDASLIMDNVLPGLYPGHVHAQRLDLVLNVPGTVEASPWTVDYVMDGNYILGNGEYVSFSTVYPGTFSLKNQFTDFNEWLYELYNLSTPLFDPNVEETEPDPTHVVVRYGNAEVEVPISEWDQNHKLPDGAPEVVADKTVTLKWITRTGDGDLVHAVTGLITRLDL